MMTAQPDLSSPPRTVVPSVRMMSPSTIGLTPSPGTTVSMCADIMIVSASGIVPGKRAMTLPELPPTFWPASSISTVAPISSQYFLMRSATSRSLREWESIWTSSSSRFLMRS
jgi:hypothetical protein